MKKKTSKQIVREYMEAIKNEKWQDIRSLCQLTWKKGNSTFTPEHFKNIYDMLLPIKNYVVMKETLNAECLHSYKIIINREITMCMNVVCEKAPYQPDINGTWGVNPTSTLKRVYNIQHSFTMDIPSIH